MQKTTESVKLIAVTFIALIVIGCGKVGVNSKIEVS